jgi:rare lipoprotein A (peptidoglycan hydrolase)
LLQNGPAHAQSVTSAESHGSAHGASGASPPGGLVLPSDLMRYVTPITTTTTTAAPTTTTTAPAPVPAPAPVTTTTAAPQEARVIVAAPPTTTTTTAPPPPAHSEVGEATWYAAAPEGYCASPTLPFGTVLTVTDNATGVSVNCTVDDREDSPYPRVVDMSPSDFARLADTSQGVVEVTISW